MSLLLFAVIIYGFINSFSCLDGDKLSYGRYFLLSFFIIKVSLSRIPWSPIVLSTVLYYLEIIVALVSVSTRSFLDTTL